MGMSVAPGWRQLPAYRIPRKLKGFGAPAATGSNDLRCWKMGDGPFVSNFLTADLRLLVTSITHGVVQPIRQMASVEYEQALGATQAFWIIDET